MDRKLSPTYLENLCRQVNKSDSPFYFYDLDYLVSHLKEMEESIDENITLWYACKANPMSAILKIFRNRGFGIDVASYGELDQVIRSGIKSKNIISTGPAKSEEYLKYFNDCGVGTIVIESINQLKLLDKIGKNKGKKIKGLLRVQLDWGKGTSVLGGNEITPFGIGEEDWKVIDIKDFPNVDIVGLHAFQWGNLLEVSELEKIWDETCKRLKNFSEIMKINLEVMDLGGGIGIPYDLHSPSVCFKEVSKVLQKLKTKYQLPKIWLELGRYAVGACGHYFAKIVDIKKIRGKNVVVLNGGINHIARPALTNQPFPVQVFDPEMGTKESISKDDLEDFSIHGPLCTALDHLGTMKLSKNIKIGQWLVFHQAGAYGFTEAMPFFLCHDLPGEFIFYNGDFMEPRTPKTSADWMI